MPVAGQYTMPLAGQYTMPLVTRLSTAWPVHHALRCHAAHCLARQARIVIKTVPKSEFEMRVVSDPSAYWCWGSQPKHVSNPVY